MKNLPQFFIASMVLAFTACHAQTKPSENKVGEITSVQNIATLADFKKIKGVDNVQEVPFHLSSTLDSISFYTKPDKGAASRRMPYNKLHNYYGFEEYDDFYAIHYSIDNNLSNSIEAFVLRSEFTAAADLTLAGANLYEIRSSNIRDVPDLNNKSFEKYGSITEVTVQEFKKASQTKVNDDFVKNPAIKLKNGNWVYTNKGKESIITLHENNDSEEGLIVNEYIGHSPYLSLEIFQEKWEDNYTAYYTLYHTGSGESTDIHTVGYPQIVPTKDWITYVTSNPDVGSDFVISQYLPKSHEQKSLLYVNFTNFKIADQTKAFWANQETFYAEVYPVNSAPSAGKKQQPAYIKIVLKSNL